MKALLFIVVFFARGLGCLLGYSFYVEDDTDVVKEFEGYLTEIEKLPTGRSLLNQLDEILQPRSLKIVRKDCLSFFKDTLSLGSTNNHAECPVVRVGCPVARPNLGEEAHPVWAVGSIKEPYYIAVAHELIHCLHRNISEIDYKTQLGSSPSHWQNFFVGCDQIRCSDSLRYGRYGRLCVNAEEERTVLGGFDKSGQRNLISEAQLMVEAGLYPRYIYQDPSRHFYECYTILNAILANFGDLSRCQPADAFKLNDIPDPRYSFGVQ